MKQQDNSAQAEIIEGSGQINFLSYISRTVDKRYPGGELGLDRVEHNVLVYTDGSGDTLPPVVMALRGGGFSMQQYLTADEARTLAKALMLAANHADDAADQQRAADFLRSQSITDRAYEVAA